MVEVLGKFRCFSEALRCCHADDMIRVVTLICSCGVMLTCCHAAMGYLACGHVVTLRC